MAEFKKIRKSKPVNNFEVVFNSNGDLAHQAYDWQGAVKEQNKVFLDHLEYAGYFSSTGGNSHIKLRSMKSGRMFHMFMSDFDEVLEEKRFQNNEIVGAFCFCRKGKSQGIRLMFEDSP